MSSEDRIADTLRSKARSLDHGARFPSVRALVEAYTASPVTVNRAMAQLVREGFLVTRPGDGTFVSKARPDAAAIDSSWQLSVLGAGPDPVRTAPFYPKASALPLGVGYADESLQPLELLAKATRRAASRAAAWSRVPVEGHPELRRWFARDVGGDATADDVLLVAGGQAALATAFRTLVPFGGAMLVESPTYFGAIAIARELGLRLVPIPTDDEGIRVDLVEAALKSSGARVLYLQPAFANPTGLTLSRERRDALLEIVHRCAAFIVEDDYARDLAFASAPPPPLFRDGRDAVVYVRSLTKSTAPGLRVAAIVARGPVVKRLGTMRATEDAFLSGLLQETALELVHASGWNGHVRSVRAELRKRRDALVSAMANDFPTARITRIPEGGFSVFIGLPEGLDDVGFVEAAERAGVQITAGTPWFPGSKTGDFIRISVAGATVSELERGVARLGVCADELLGGKRPPTTSGRRVPKR